MLQPSTTDTSITQSRYGRRFDEEFQREVAALACRPGAKQEQVARDLDVSPYSVSRWKKLYGNGPAVASPAGVNVAEFERRIKALERENADLREQRAILKKSGRHCLGSSARRHGVISTLAGEFSTKSLCPCAGREPQRLPRRAAEGAATTRPRQRAPGNQDPGGVRGEPAHLRQSPDHGGAVPRGRDVGTVQGSA